MRGRTQSTLDDAEEAAIKVSSKYEAARKDTTTPPPTKADLEKLVADQFAAMLTKEKEKQDAAIIERDAANWRRDFLPPTRDMTGLAIDWAAWKITFPPDTEPDLRRSLRDHIHALSPSSPNLPSRIVLESDFARRRLLVVHR